MQTLIFRMFGVVCCSALLVACSLPRNAPGQNEVIGAADKENAPFAVYPVTRAFLPRMENWPSTTRGYSWVERARGPASSVIAAGDKIDLAVWDNNENSLVTSTDQKVAEVLGIEVSPQGTVYVPYVEEVYIAGQTPNEARKTIQTEIDAILPSAQVLLTQTAGQKNRVDLVGGVENPGNFPLPDRNFTVLGLLSAGGGVPPEMRNPQVRLHRGDNIYGASLDRLYENPRLDTTLRGGDKVIVEEDDRHFLSFGAAGKQEIIYFTKDKITASDAMSLIGGLKNARANPKGILVLREYPASAISSDGRGPAKQQAVFTVDLTTADGLFSARNFDINSGDLVLVSESPITSIQTVFNLFGTFVGVSNAAADFNN